MALVSAAASKTRAAKASGRTPVQRRKAVRKEESMRIRVSSEDKEILERAAGRLGLGVSAFVLSSAMEKARSTLGE
jgi:uncharacterized protein (DUF1778 family)